MWRRQTDAAFLIIIINSSLKLIREVVRGKRAELGMTAFIASLSLLISAFLMYHVENPAQPDKFPDIFSSIWWAIAALTTIGYGDIYFITMIGKIINGLVAFLGLGLIALPTGIISAGSVEKIKNPNSETKSYTCPHRGKEINI